MEDLDFKIAPYQSKPYYEFLHIRYEILRKPLGLDYTAEQLASEQHQVHIVALSKFDIVIGGLILVFEEHQKVKMRQVAISNEFQSKGVGQQLVVFAEKYAKENNATYMHCHARDTAILFYEKLGYHIKGEEVLEVGIPHRYMYKEL